MDPNGAAAPPAGTTVYRFIRSIQGNSPGDKPFVNGNMPMTWAYCDSAPNGNDFPIQYARFFAAAYMCLYSDSNMYTQ